MKQQINPDHLSVHHDTTEGRFFYPSAGAKDAQLTYTYDKSDETTTMVMGELYVPTELDNTGLDEKIMFEALTYAQNNGFRVKPEGDQITTYIQHHPEFQKLVDVLFE